MLYKKKWRSTNSSFYSWRFKKKRIKWNNSQITCYLKKNWYRKTCNRRISWSRKKSRWSSCSCWSRKRKTCRSKEKSSIKERCFSWETPILANISQWRKRRRIYWADRRRKNNLRISSLSIIWSECYRWWLFWKRDHSNFCSF